MPLEWDGGEKFYHSPQWMKYLIDHFLRPGAIASRNLRDSAGQDPRIAEFTFDHVCNGTIDAQGEDPDDRWQLIVEDNVVKVAEAQITYGNAVKV